MILAAGCFAKSSPRFEKWILDHPKFGPVVKNWRANKAIPLRAKWMATAGMAFGAVSMGFVPISWPGKAVFWALDLACLAYVWSCPHGVASDPDRPEVH